MPSYAFNTDENGFVPIGKYGGWGRAVAPKLRPNTAYRDESYYTRQDSFPTYEQWEAEQERLNTAIAIPGAIADDRDGIVFVAIPV